MTDSGEIEQVEQQEQRGASDERREREFGEAGRSSATSGLSSGVEVHTESIDTDRVSCGGAYVCCRCGKGPRERWMGAVEVGEHMLCDECYKALEDEWGCLE